MLGVVNLDKPVGPTSHDMVDLVRRLTGMRRIGHAGTLDPLASGVLPILVGAATRFSDDLTGGAKRYEAVIRLGLRSATDDAQGPLEVGRPAARAARDRGGAGALRRDLRAAPARLLRAQGGRRGRASGGPCREPGRGGRAHA